MKSQYTTNSRLEKVTTGTHSATYGYLTNSDLIETITHKSGTTTRLGITRNHDTSDRLDGVTNTYGTQSQSFGVTEFDDMNRRKKITREDGTRWNYGYNAKGEVTTGLREKTAAPNTAVPGWSHGYSFDEIGNRLGTTTNGRASTYTPNNLNQITARTVPRAFDVIGKAASTAAVTVNTLATTRLDEYFYKELPAGSGAVHVPYSVAATDGTVTSTRSGGKFLPATPEISAYDFEGNLTSDGRFTYTWDAENRLIAMVTLAPIPIAAKRKLAFAYDAMGRRIRKTTWNGTPTGTWQSQLDLRFLHELGGWNIQAEITADNRFLRTYTWGTDLVGLGGSPSRDSAGGVGGLLFTKLHPDNSIHAHGMDLNGNVTLLVSTTTGQATATYDYGPFGEPIRESGEYAKLNPYRFSTKYADDETGLLDYGYRYYDPLNGRWPSRDPIEEEGGENLYGMVKNDLLNRTDYLGQYEIDFHYYTIYYLLRAKCYTPEEANSVATASQYVDDNPATEPIFNSEKKRAKYHFHGSNPTKPTKRNPPLLETEIRGSLLSSSFIQAGIRLHTYADTWSHEGFTAWWNSKINKRIGKRPPIGHLDTAEGGHAPDRPYNDINKALEASFAIYSLIPSKGEWISPSIIREDLIRGFSDRNPAGSVRSSIHKANIRIRFGDEAVYNLNK